MSEEPVTDDQSHYEVSLTAGQAFLAFVLLLLSLAASFAFGLMIGRGQGDDKLLANSSPSIVDEANTSLKRPQERSIQLGHGEAAIDEPEVKAPVRKPARSAVAPSVTIREEAAAVKTPEPATRPVPPGAAGAVPFSAQLLSTTDQKKAEALAARVIDGGFLSTYVDRSTNEKGPLFRVRVNFASEQEARAAETRLKAFSQEVWITRQ